MHSCGFYRRGQSISYPMQKGVFIKLTNLPDYPKHSVVRCFDIEAISIPMVYNKYGDHDPNGMLYVLKKGLRTDQAKGTGIF